MDFLSSLYGQAFQQNCWQKGSLSFSVFFFWLWIISLGTDYNGVLLVCAHWLNDLFGKVMSMICNFMCLMKCLIEVRCFTSILIWVWFFGTIFLLEHHVFDAMLVSIITSLEKLGRHFCGFLLQVSKCDSKCRGHKMQRRQSCIRGSGRKSYLRELVTLYLTLSWIDMLKLLKKKKKVYIALLLPITSTTNFFRVGSAW